MVVKMERFRFDTWGSLIAFVACDSMFLLPCLHMKKDPATSLQIGKKRRSRNIVKISEHRILTVWIRAFWDFYQRDEVNARRHKQLKVKYHPRLLLGIVVALSYIRASQVMPCRNNILCLSRFHQPNQLSCTETHFASLNFWKHRNISSSEF